MTSFIEENGANYGVYWICKALLIAPSTYCAHAAREANPDKAPTRAHHDMALEPEAERGWDQSYQVFGPRKVWRQFKREQASDPLNGGAADTTPGHPECGSWQAGRSDNEQHGVPCPKTR